MLSENIKKYRKDKNFSQEDLALQLHVVRQTISKWENSTSVPDAGQLITLAEVLGVSVEDLLGVEIENPDDIKDIAAELAKSNEQIAKYAEEKRIHTEAGKVRGLIFWLSVVSVVAIHLIGDEISAILISSILLIAVLVILYRNIKLLSLDFSGSSETGSGRAVTVFNIVLIVLMIIFAVLLKSGKININENREELFAAAFVSVTILFTGIAAPKLPYSRHIGLRLPWTIRDKGAWNIAHKVLGIISIPLGLAYISLAFVTSNVKLLSIIVIGTWIGIPGMISLLYVLNKVYKK